jgi:hypothetical protein
LPFQLCKDILKLTAFKAISFLLYPGDLGGIKLYEFENKVEQFNSYFQLSAFSWLSFSKLEKIVLDLCFPSPFLEGGGGLSFVKTIAIARNRECQNTVKLQRVLGNFLPAFKMISSGKLEHFTPGYLRAPRGHPGVPKEQ